MAVNIWKSYECSAVDETNIESILTVMNTTEPVVEIRPVKISGQHNDQLPDGLLAQLVESCTGIAEVTGSNPVRAWIFFNYQFSSVHNCGIDSSWLLLTLR